MGVLKRKVNERKKRTIIEDKRDILKRGGVKGGVAENVRKAENEKRKGVKIE